MVNNVTGLGGLLVTTGVVLKNTLEQLLDINGASPLANKVQMYSDYIFKSGNYKLFLYLKLNRKF